MSDVNVEQVLVIEDAEAYGLAVELALLTGESMDAVVIRAIREGLEQERRIRDKVAKVMALAGEIAAHMEPGATSDTSWLYDDDGFPV